MSDSIIVRVTLDSYDLVHPGEKQAQVYVQIPGVARASWLLDADFCRVMKGEPWPHVVDSAQEDYVQRGVVSDSDSAAARAAIVKWLADDANHDAMQAAWELDEARRHPVARKLLAENGRLRGQYAEAVATVAGLEQKRVELERIANAERARVAELEAELRIGPAWTCPTCSKENRRDVCVTCETDRPDPSERSADKLSRFFAPVAALREAKPADLRAEDTADILTLADAQHADATYNPTFQTIELELTATQEQWTAWQKTLMVDLARTTNRSSCVTSHATWRGIHVVIRCWLVKPQTGGDA